MKKIINFIKLNIAILGVLLIVVIASIFVVIRNNNSNIGGRTSNFWDSVGTSYIKTNEISGYNVLINGSNKYLNFGSVSGTNGYGIRDNNGTIEIKSSGGAWSSMSAGLGTVTKVGIAVPVGLSITGTPITTAGTSTISLATGYNIPKTASTTDWQTAYSWGNWALQGFEKQAQASSSFSLLTHNHASLYDVLGQATSTLTSHTNTYDHANYNTAYGWGNHATQGYMKQSWATSTYVQKANASTTLLSVSGVSWFTGLITAVNETLTGLLTTAQATISSILKIPFGADLMTGTQGTIGIDTTSGQFRFNTGSATTSLVGDFDKVLAVASTTIGIDAIPFKTGTSTFNIWNPTRAVTLNQIYCETTVGTTSLQCWDGTNYVDYMTCDSDGTTDSSLSNNTFTAGEDFNCKVRGLTGTPNWLKATFNFSYTLD